MSKSDGTVVFGQLLGMCDHVTFPLGMNMYVANAESFHALSRSSRL